MARVRSRQSAPKQDDILVFAITKESECAECAVALGRGNFLKIEHDRPLCMACADLGHLLFLPSGDAALTRRAGKYSTLRAVVLLQSSAQALRTAGDPGGGGRATARGAGVSGGCGCGCAGSRSPPRRGAPRRGGRRVRHQVRAPVGGTYPGCPPREQQTIARHAAHKHSGRIGRSAAAKRFDPGAIDLAVRAHVRHAHTRYDQLLGQGHDRAAARASVAADVARVLEAWQAPHARGAHA